MRTTIEPVGSVLTRTTGFLKTVCSHSLQPYRGCPFGRSLCGVGCYVRHNPYVTRGREWGTFLEVRAGAADAYRAGFRRESAWARKSRGRFSVFLSSSTEPFPPQESRFGVTRAVLEAMAESPPDELIVQTHSHRVADAADVLRDVASRCDLRVHVSIETDLDRLPGLPPHASPVEARFRVARGLKDAGLRVIVTVSPLLPIGDPERFFARVAEVADGVVLDHFIGGDGSPEGSRTRRTALPAVMEAVEPRSVDLEYRERMGDVARRYLPGRVGFHIDGFAGRWAAD